MVIAPPGHRAGEHALHRLEPFESTHRQVAALQHTVAAGQLQQVLRQPLLVSFDAESAHLQHQPAVETIDRQAWQPVIFGVHQAQGVGHGCQVAASGQGSLQPLAPERVVDDLGLLPAEQAQLNLALAVQVAMRQKRPVGADQGDDAAIGDVGLRQPGDRPGEDPGVALAHRLVASRLEHGIVHNDHSRTNRSASMETAASEAAIAGRQLSDINPSRQRLRFISDIFLVPWVASWMARAAGCDGRKIRPCVLHGPVPVDLERQVPLCQEYSSDAVLPHRRIVGHWLAPSPMATIPGLPLVPSCRNRGFSNEHRFSPIARHRRTSSSA